jgi:AbrB family looped-hinge helix DNA binding protein
MQARTRRSVLARHVQFLLDYSPIDRFLSPAYLHSQIFRYIRRKMMSPDTAKVGKRGTVVIPAALRRRFGLEEGSLVVVEVRDEGILIRPAVAMPVEIYSPERRAEFLLSTAVDAEDYARALEEVRRMGLDPATVPHQPPPGA